MPEVRDYLGHLPGLQGTNNHTHLLIWKVGQLSARWSISKYSHFFSAYLLMHFDLWWATNTYYAWDDTIVRRKR